MPNSHRGEIEAVLNGKSYTLCLTLGALAELENAFGTQGLAVLSERLGQGSISAADIIHIIRAGLKGGGIDMDIETVSRLKTDNGIAGLVGIAVRLLQATFGEPDETR